MRSVKCTVVVGTKTLFFSDGDVTSALSVVLSNTPREPHELPATLRARGGAAAGYAGGASGLGRGGRDCEGMGVWVRRLRWCVYPVVGLSWAGTLGQLLRSIG